MTPPWDLRKRVDEADFAGAQVVVKRHGRPVAAIVPTYDLQACQALEARSSARVEELKRLANAESVSEMDEDCLPWDEVTEKYGAL